MVLLSILFCNLWVFNNRSQMNKTILKSIFILTQSLGNILSKDNLKESKKVWWFVFYKGNFCIVFAVKYVSVFYILLQPPLLPPHLPASSLPLSFPPFFHFLLSPPSSSLSVGYSANTVGGNMGHGGYAVHTTLLPNWEMKSSEPQVRCHAVFHWVAIPVLQSGPVLQSRVAQLWNLKQSLKNLQSKNRIYFYVTGLHFLPFPLLFMILTGNFSLFLYAIETHERKSKKYLKSVIKVGLKNALV